MNFSFMSFSCPELSLDDMLSLAVELGYSGIEPRAQSDHGHGVELDASADQRSEIKKKFDDSPITLCCIAVSSRFADPETADDHVNDTHQVIDLAGDLECDRIRVFGGQLGKALTREAAVDQVAGALGSLAAHASDRGVALCVETHDAWRDPKHVAAVMEKAGHPNIAVNWDIMHPIIAGAATMEESFETMKPWIKHVHVHDGHKDNDGKLVLDPIGKGTIDHTAALRCLKESGYNGFISGEWIGWEPHDVHLPRELNLLKEIEAGL